MDHWKNKLKADPVPWLLESNPWTRYRTLSELLDYPEDDKMVRQARSDLLNHEQVIQLAEETKDWIPIAPTRNSDPKISYFKLRVLAEFGLKQEDLGLSETVDKAMEHMIDDMFAVRGQTPDKPEKGKPYEKPDLTADVWHVSPCNSPVITCTLMKLGVRDDRVRRAIEATLERWQDETGWFCHFFFVESQFNKLKIGCPVAGLLILEILSMLEDKKDAPQSRYAYEPIRFHKDYGRSLYYFGRSKKFRTFKYPFVWYNALYLAEVLTRFEFLREEPVVTELIDWIIDAQTKDGTFRATSVFMNYNGWDFANKKEPSPWITFLCCRILRRYFG